jgi:hypothetical protein
MLWIRHVGIERHDIINDDISGWLQTFLQLRDMEHIMHTSQGWRQLQSVCHIPQLGQDRKWTDVTWCQPAFDHKSLHTLRGQDTKVHAVTCFELKRLTSLVGITFLPNPGGFQVILNVMDYLLGLSDNVWMKDHPLAKLNPA